MMIVHYALIQKKIKNQQIRIIYYSNKHYDECYLILKDVDITKLKLQKEEVSDVKYFSKDELLERIENNFDGLTEKTGSWHFLKKILENDRIKQNREYKCKHGGGLHVGPTL